MKQLFIICLFIPLFSFGQYTQLGADIDGIQAGEQSGNAVQLNGDGSIIAISASRNDTSGTSSGQVRVSEWDGMNWTQKGNSLNGSASGDNLGKSLDLNESGEVLIAGAPGFTTNPTSSGYARVFAWDGTNWVQRGTDFLGYNADDSYGTSVSMDASGSVIAIAGEPFTTTSYVRIFEWDGMNWNQMGTDIIGTAPKDGFGRAVALNADGSSIVISAPNFDGNQGDEGMIQVYDWDGTNWTQRGGNILGANEDDFFGKGATINDNGNIVAAGADETSTFRGYAKVFEWNGSSWTQKGAKISGEPNAVFFGTANDLNGSGSILISGSLADYAKVFEFDGNNWIELDRLSSEVSGDQLGVSVTIDKVGGIVAAGARSNDAGGSNAGHTRVYQNAIISSIDDVNPITNTVELYPNPSMGIINIRSKDFMDTSIQVYSQIGQLVYSTNMMNELEQIELDVPNGVYIVTIQSGKDSFSQKLVIQK